MRKLLTFLVTLAGLYNINDIVSAQSPNFLWVQQAGGTDEDEGLGIAVDGSDNSIVTGWFEGTTTNGPNSNSGQ